MDRTSVLKYLNPEALQGLGSFQLIAKVIVEGFLVGLHKSPFHGFSAEFSDYRPYMRGDDLKLIDWKVYGRTNRYYVKRFEEETNLNAYLLLDRSNSMNFTSHKITKLEYGKFLLSALSYLLFKQRDNFSLATFSDRIDIFTAMRHSMNHLFYIYGVLDKLKPSGTTEIVEAIHQVAEKIKHRGLIILISDFQGISLEETRKAMLHFLHKKNELIVFHLVDPQEIHFDFSGEIEFVDMETGETIKTQPDKIHEEIIRIYQQYYQNLETFCNNHRIEYHRIITTDSLFKAMTAFFHKRLRMF